MGEDWERKTQKAYKRLLEDSRGRLEPAPLFLGPEEQITLYPCQLVAEDLSVSAGRRLTLLRHSKLARIAVLDGNRVIGSVSGDAVRDLRKLFETHARRAPGVIAVEVASATPGSVHFEVRALARRSGKSRTPRK